MRYLYLCFGILLIAGSAFALEPSCQELVDSLETAFDEASSVVSSVTIKQGNREMAYIRSQLLKDNEGEWQTEVLEQRGMQRPGGGEDSGQGEFAFDCEGHELQALDTNSFQLGLQESNKDIPVSAYTLLFNYHNGWYVPKEITANFQVSIVFIPVSGTFNTVFSDWGLPLQNQAD